MFIYAIIYGNLLKEDTLECLKKYLFKPYGHWSWFYILLNNNIVPSFLL